MRKYLSFVAVAALLAAPAAALAGEFYAGGGAGSSKAQQFCDGAAALGVSCDDSASSARGFAGYQASRVASVEIGYSDLGKVGGSFGPARVSVSANALDVSGLFGVPMGEKAVLYSRLGVYYATEKVSSNVGLAGDYSSSGLTVGFGVRVDLSQRVGLRVEWQRYGSVGDSDIGKSDVDVLSVSGLVRF